MAGRITLALYNTYDKSKMREAHRRALARAGPVALAFDCNATLSTHRDSCSSKSSRTQVLQNRRDSLSNLGCNLVTFGFPYEKDMRTPAEITDWISTTTSIGEGGKYLIELAQAGRFQTFDYPKGGIPPQLGTAIATTCHPDEKKAITPEDCAEMVAHGESVCLIFGLGPHGLKKDVFDIAKHHMDITGKGISMETCTALGAIPAVLSTLLAIDR